MATLPSTAVKPEDLSWPIITIDFEASGLGPRTYPIEVGIAVWNAPGEPIRSWSTLIKPTAHWIEDGDWQVAAEAIHGLKPHDLRQGASPAEALAALNRLIPVGRKAYCDGGPYDAYWLRRLTSAASGAPHFVLSDWGAITHSLPSQQIAKIYEFQAQHEIPHRAAQDAALHIRALAAGLDIVPDEAELPV